MGPNPCAHLHDPPSSQDCLPRQRVVALFSSKAGSPATLTYLIGYPSRISNHILDILVGYPIELAPSDVARTRTFPSKRRHV